MNEAPQVGPARPRDEAPHDGQIPIANVYFLLCYAWNVLEEKDTLADVGAVDSTSLLDLFARVLVSGTQRLLRRGLDRGYLPCEAVLPAVRGKVLATPTLRRDLLRQGLAACAWDELEYGTLPNRLLKTTFLRLSRTDELDPKTKADVHDMLRWLAPVQQIDVRSEHFRRVQLHRNNRIYGFLLHVCEFVHEHWLPTEEGRGRHFRDFARNGLPKVFERFVLNFYKRELPDWDVGAPWIDWSADGQNALSRELLPVMKTDVCLSRPGRAIILDTKFYAEALKAGPYGTPKLLSGNLYQMYTYLRQKSCDPGWESAEGVLLYPRTSRDLDAEFSTHGHRIRAVTLNLWQPWQAIHGDLLNIVIQETPPQSPTLQNPP